MLTPDAVAEIADVAGRRGTWHRDAIVLDDTQRHVQRIERLRREVDAASRRRKSWVALVELVVIVGVVWVCANLLEVTVRSLAGGMPH
jgi:hypothetical protein